MSRAPVVGIFRDANDTPQGLWYASEITRIVEGEHCVLFHVDQLWVRAAYRGDSAMPLSILRYAAGAFRRLWRSRWYIGGVAMPLSYVFLSRWIDKVWTLNQRDIPARERALLEGLVEECLGDRWDRERLRFRTHLLPPPVPTYVLEQPNARTLLAEYESWNPEWRAGWALPMIGEVNVRVMRGLLRRAATRSSRRRRKSR